MKTREVFRILCKQLEAVLLPMGFSRIKDTTGLILPWNRLLGTGRYETIWCQMDKWPRDPWIGTQFLVEFQRAPTMESGAIKATKRTRWADLLTEDERCEVQDRQNRVIAKLRVPSVDEFNEFMGFPVPEGKLYLEKHRMACRPVEYGGRRLLDIWMRVFDRADVEMWAEFVARWLPTGLERFAATLRPSPPTGK
jgi:hypothetical protein